VEWRVCESTRRSLTSGGLVRTSTMAIGVVARTSSAWRPARRPLRRGGHSSSTASAIFIVPPASTRRSTRLALAAACIEGQFDLIDLRISAKSAGLNTAIVQMGPTNVIDVGNAKQLGPIGQLKPHDFGGRIWISQTDAIGYPLIKRTVLESPRPSRWQRHSRTTTGTRPLHLPQRSAGIIAL
jgi:hypothetical protein